MVCAKEFSKETPDHGLKAITLNFHRDGKLGKSTYATYSDDDEEEEEEEDMTEKA
jgi:hypothetical protein